MASLDSFGSPLGHSEIPRAGASGCDAGQCPRSRDRVVCYGPAQGEHVSAGRCRLHCQLKRTCGDSTCVASQRESTTFGLNRTEAWSRRAECEIGSSNGCAITLIQRRCKGERGATIWIGETCAPAAVYGVGTTAAAGD